MAFIVNPDGSIKVDTADELRAVLTLRGQMTPTEQQANAPAQTPSATAAPEPRPAIVRSLIAPPIAQGSLLDGAARIDGYRKLYKDLEPKQREFIGALLDTPELTDDELRARLDLASNIELRGLMIGVIRRATNRKLPNPINKEIRRKRDGRQRVYRYSLTSDFHGAIVGGADRQVAV